MTKRRISNFLILEVLIAFLLISMTILPFTSYPYRAFRKELSFLEKMTVEPYFTESFNEAFAQIDQETVLLENKSVPFGKDNILLLKRSADIEVVSDKEKTSYSLITINVRIATKNSTQTRQKNYTVKSKGAINAR